MEAGEKKPQRARPRDWIDLAEFAGGGSLPDAVTVLIGDVTERSSPPLKVSEERRR